MPPLKLKSKKTVAPKTPSFDPTNPVGQYTPEQVEQILNQHGDVFNFQKSGGIPFFLPEEGTFNILAQLLPIEGKPIDVQMRNVPQFDENGKRTGVQELPTPFCHFVFHQLAEGVEESECQFRGTPVGEATDDNPATSFTVKLNRDLLLEMENDGFYVIAITKTTLPTGGKITFGRIESSFNPEEEE